MAEPQIGSFGVPVQEIPPLRGSADLCGVEEGGKPSFLVKSPGSGSPWGFSLKVEEVKDRLYVDMGSKLIQDLRVGERTGAWGYISLVNCTSSELRDTRLEVKGNELFQADRRILKL